MKRFAERVEGFAEREASARRIAQEKDRARIAAPALSVALINRHGFDIAERETDALRTEDAAGMPLDDYRSTIETRFLERGHGERGHGERSHGERSHGDHAGCKDAAQDEEENAGSRVAPRKARMARSSIVKVAILHATARKPKSRTEIRKLSS
ncbi:MAG TPA: hypothetical protein VKP01_04470 [Saliniramus sp.]|nr:hypothetical protein [Saliniramus sp.]